jgi:uncharacterized protein (TIGR03086 family)
MGADVLDLYGRAADWTAATLANTKDLDATTPCDEWSVRDLLNHVFDTQNYFSGTARGEDVSPPGPNPPDIVSADPRADFDRIRGEVTDAFRKDGVIEKTGPALGIAFSDLLIHTWDLARATGQDAKMPDGLAEAAYGLIHGKFSDEQRKGMFKPEIEVGDDASAEDRLLAYTGRTPV